MRFWAVFLRFGFAMLVSGCLYGAAAARRQTQLYPPRHLATSRCRSILAFRLPHLYFCHTTPRIAAYLRGEHCPQPCHLRPRSKHSAPAVAHATKGSLKPFPHVSGCLLAWRQKPKPPLIHRLHQRKPRHAALLRCHAFGKHRQRAHPHAVIAV